MRVAIAAPKMPILGINNILTATETIAEIKVNQLNCLVFFVNKK